MCREPLPADHWSRWGDQRTLKRRPHTTTNATHPVAAVGGQSTGLDEPLQHRSNRSRPAKRKQHKSSWSATKLRLRQAVFSTELRRPRRLRLPRLLRGLPRLLHLRRLPGRPRRLVYLDSYSFAPTASTRGGRSSSSNNTTTTTTTTNNNSNTPTATASDAGRPQLPVAEAQPTSSS